MRKTLALTAIVLACALCLAPAADAQNLTTYDVTITNVTPGQVVSPPVVVSHTDAIGLFELGAPASPELAALAEDADTSGYEALLPALPQVLDFAIADAPLPPGASVTLQVQARFPFSHISAVGMLVTTNDAFFGLDTVQVPLRRRVAHLRAGAYDAGSEANNESCDFIPGPPCGNPFLRDTDGAEGFVHVHSGVHGIADLVPAEHDWRNPVVTVRIQAAR
jgi:hypothetical protein